MNVVDVKTYCLGFVLDRRFANATDWHTKRSITLVKISTDEGITGWGEAYGPPSGISRIIETYFKDKLVGSDPFRTEYYWQQSQVKKGIPPGAVGGVDIALWDLKAKALKVPLFELLGGKFCDSFLPYSSGYPYKEETPESLDQLEFDIERTLSQGFKAVKMKIGFGLERDKKRISLVRKRFGESVELMVDANQGYSLMTCLELIPFLESNNIKWFEEPLPWHSFSGYQELKKRVSIPIAGGEAENTMQGFIEAIRNGIVDIIQPDVPLCGGITAAKRIATLAFAFQIEFYPHIFGTVLGLPATLHLLASLPNSQPLCLFPKPALLEWDINPNPMAEKLLKKPIKISDGIVKIPEGTGLGVEVNEEAFEEFLLK